MPNYQLADYGMFDPNSEWAKQAAAQVMQQQAAQQAPSAEIAQAPQTAPAVAVQQSAPQQPAPQQPVPQMPNNNGLAAKAANVLTPLDDAGRALASQIAKFKMNYDAAQAAGDTAGMAQAHAGAEALRNAAGKYGIDLSRLGANDSTAAYQAMLQADYAKGVADIANMATPQEYYQQQIQQNMANGMSRRRAEESALGALEAYEGQYRRTLGNAFARYGVNDQGEMNRFGAQIANLLYGQNPQNVALYDQYYANPMQQWKFDKNMEVQDKLYGQKVDFGQHQFDWNRQLNNDKFNMDKWMAQYNGNMTLALQKMKQDFQKASVDEQIALARDNPALYMLLYGGGKGNDSGLSKAQSETMQSLENAISQARQSVDNSKSREEDGKAVEDARTLMEKLYSDGKIDKDTYTTAYDRINQLIGDRDRKWQKYNYANEIPNNQ